MEERQPGNRRGRSGQWDQEAHGPASRGGGGPGRRAESLCLIGSDSGVTAASTGLEGRGARRGAMPVYWRSRTGSRRQAQRERQYRWQPRNKEMLPRCVRKTLDRVGRHRVCQATGHRGEVKMTNGATARTEQHEREAHSGVGAASSSSSLLHLRCGLAHPPVCLNSNDLPRRDGGAATGRMGAICCWLLALAGGITARALEHAPLCPAGLLIGLPVWWLLQLSPQRACSGERGKSTGRPWHPHSLSVSGARLPEAPACDCKDVLYGLVMRKGANVNAPAGHP